MGASGTKGRGASPSHFPEYLEKEQDQLLLGKYSPGVWGPDAPISSSRLARPLRARGETRGLRGTRASDQPRLATARQACSMGSV